MAEYIYIPEQTVNFGQGVLLNGSFPCNRNSVLHDDGSSLFTLRGPSGFSNQCAARYQITFTANIAVPTGETVGPIDIALTIDGETIPTSLAEVTPAAVEEYFVATTIANIDVVRGCCVNVAVENVTADNIPILVRNAVLDIVRTA